MHKFNIAYSTKNIPHPTNQDYTMRFIDKTEHLLKRMRWRAFYYLNPEKRKSTTKEAYGFKSQLPPPFIPQLKGFEDDMLRLIEGLKFRKPDSPMQRKLQEDVKRIKNEKNLIVPADKTGNYYSMPKEQYLKLMSDNVTSTYKKANKQDENMINRKAREITDTLQISDRVHILAPKDAYITLKDHKDNFHNRPQCRVINPTKSELGVIAKKELDRINTALLEATKVNQWNSTGKVTDWFKNLQIRKNTTFLTFDVINFYPSITSELLNNALSFAQQHTNISKLEMDIILQSKNTLLYHEDQPWQKANTESLF